MSMPNAIMTPTGLTQDNPLATPLTQTLDKDRHLRFAYLLAETPPRRLTDLEQVLRWGPQQGPLWVHLDQPQAHLAEWLHKHHPHDPAVLRSLFGDVRRPRVEVVNRDHLVIVFRTLSFEGTPAVESGQNIRVWLSPLRVITIAEGPSAIFDDTVQQIEAGSGPKNTPEFLIQLLDNVVKRSELMVLQIDADMTDVEMVEDKGEVVPAEQPRTIRRRATHLRRSMTPYREVLVRLNHLRVHWLQDHVHQAVDSMVEDVAQVVEELDGILDRAHLVQEAITDRRAGELNQRVYTLTLISGIMLPLTFLTGLLGVNLDGIPGAHEPWAFPCLCAMLGVIGVVQYYLFRRLRWWG
jgi:zinc transporter